MSAQTYPRIRAQLINATSALLITAWVKRSSTDAAHFLLRQEEAASLAEALELLSRLAGQERIALELVDIDVSLQTLLAAN